MLKERKICIRITQGRIVGAVLMAASVVNLIVVGAAFGAAAANAAPTVTPVLSHPASTATLLVPTSTLQVTNTLTPTQTPSPTATNTPTLIPTPTETPSLVSCIPQYSWPIYFTSRGDTLFSLALATGSSVQELVLANCLPGDLIRAGQPLYVPRLPVDTPTITPVTPTDTPATPTPPNTPTVFQSHYVCFSQITDQAEFSFSVTPEDPEVVKSLSARFHVNDGGQWIDLPMQLQGDVYSGNASIPGIYSTADTVYYSFTATDNLDSITQADFNAPLEPCYLG